MEDNGFELTNEPTENEAEFVESDPYRTEALADIVLYVDWESKEATVDTRYRNGSTSKRVWDKLAYEFTLPANVDAVQFPEFYKEHVQPLLQKMGQNFEIDWNGSNFVGQFTDDDDHELNYMGEIEEVLKGAPEHSRYVYFDVGESFQFYSDIIEMLAPGIDFLTIDLTNMENVKKIREQLEADDYLYVESDEDVQNDLQRMQKAILEEREEEDE
jgi:hypothetical protein